MKHWFTILTLGFLLGVFGCSGKKAEELFETAQLEELQNNRAHATKLYHEIVANYPDTEFAEKAKARLAVIEKGD
jgi:TolA-binding protein